MIYSSQSVWHKQISFFRVFSHPSVGKSNYNNIGNIFVMNKKTKTVCHSFLLRIERPIIWSGVEVMVRLWRPANLQYFEVMYLMKVENEEYCFPLSNYGLSQSRFENHTILFLTKYAKVALKFFLFNLIQLTMSMLTPFNTNAQTLLWPWTVFNMRL